MTAEMNADAQGLFATFLLGEAAFGVRAERVQEVVRPGIMTPVHRAPAEVVGIRNLRGHIVTVIDLAARLELGQVEGGRDSRVVIVGWQDEPVGLLVDVVTDTIAVEPEAIERPPANVHGVRARNLSGVCRKNDRLVAILDLDSVLSLDDS